jgi:hypothetical protein
MFIPFAHTEALSPAKLAPLSIDLSDILSNKCPQTPSSLSTYDGTSVRADDENMKQMSELETLSIGCLRTMDSIHSQELNILPKAVTLGDMVAKRGYTRRPKDASKTTDKAKETGKRRRKLEHFEDSTEEVLNKKEKLENNKVNKVAVSPIEGSMVQVPEIVFKDGKAQVMLPEVSLTDAKGNNKLEVVQNKKKKVTTSSSFKQSSHTEKWTEKETRKFYRALELFGTDFSMIANVFKNRNRNQIKNKFLREEKIAPEKVNSIFKPTKASHIQSLFRKLDRMRKARNPTLINSVEQNKDNNIAQSNAIPAQKGFIVSFDEICIRDRNSRSGSFHSTTSIDTVDRSIVEDLADILLPQKALNF